MVARGLLVVLPALSGLWLGGCTHWRPDTSHSLLHESGPSKTAPASWSGPTDSLPATFVTAARWTTPPDVFLRPVEDDGNRSQSAHRIWDLSMPSVGDNGQPGRLVSARYFESTHPGVRPLVIILPIYGKSHYPSRKLARVLTRSPDEAFHVLMLTGETNLYRPDLMEAARTGHELVDEIRDTAERMRITVLDTVRLIDWAVARPEVEPGRIGVAGFSFSAVLASLVMALDERVGAGVFFMGGGHIHEVFARCHGNQVAHAREVLARRFGWSRDTFAERLEPVFRPVEPLAYADHLVGRPILLAESPVDRIIPEVSRQDFRDALGDPERLVLRFSHRTAFLSMTPMGANYANRKIRGFFLDHL